MVNPKRVRKLLSILSRMPYRQGMLKGVAAGVEHAAMLKQIAPVFVVDIGANVGQFSLAAAVTLPGARIIAFEPLSGPAAVFRSALEAFNQVRLIQCAIGPEAGTMQMNLSGESDSSSLLTIGERQTQMFPQTRAVGMEAIVIAPLEDHVHADQIGEPALLKIDVQGFEAEALKGCDSLLHKFAYVYLECSCDEFYLGQAFADEMIEMMRARSFRMYGMFNPIYDGPRIVQADFLFERHRQQ